MKIILTKKAKFIRKKTFGIRRFWKRSHPIFKVCCFILLAAVLTHLLSFVFWPLADFVSNCIAPYIRLVISNITGILPFSVAETFIMMIIPLIIAFYVIMKSLEKTQKKWSRVFSLVLSVFMLMYSTFVFSFATCYHGTTLPEKFGFETGEVSVEDLKNTAEYLLDGAEAQLESIDFNYGSFSVMPYSFSELNDKLNKAYEKTAADYDFIHHFNSRIKQVALSDPMSYTHITGIYSYYTGEANICTSYPDYTIPYTAAHEMSHQRGYAPEEDANFMAFVVSMHSDDPYILYSAYLNVFEYVSDALYSADAEAYYEIIRSADYRILYEEQSFSSFFDKYRDSTASKVTGAVNDTFLKSQGEAKGTASYGEVVDLTVAYVNTMK